MFSFCTFTIIGCISAKKGYPLDLSLDIDGNEAFALDEGLDSLLRVTLDTGLRTFVASGSRGAGPKFMASRGLDDFGNDVLCFPER